MSLLTSVKKIVYFYLILEGSIAVYVPVIPIYIKAYIWTTKGKLCFSVMAENEPGRVISIRFCKTDGLEQIPGITPQEKSIYNYVFIIYVSSTEYSAKNVLCSKTGSTEELKKTIEKYSETRSDKEIMTTELTNNNLITHSEKEKKMGSLWPGNVILISASSIWRILKHVKFLLKSLKIK